jgi:hypothetical protein
MNEIQRVSPNFSYFSGEFSSSITRFGGLIFNNLNTLLVFGGSSSRMSTRFFKSKNSVVTFCLRRSLFEWVGHGQAADAGNGSA